jgi:hypothetical protein
MIVNFSVVGNPHGSVFVRHRLAAPRQIDNAQPTMSEGYLSIPAAQNLLTLGIGSTVELNIGHPLQNFRQRNWL